MFRRQTLKEARWIFAVLGLFAVVTTPFCRWLAGLWALLTVYVFWFFRDPDRIAPADPRAVVAAADGVVVDVVEMEEAQVLHRPMKRIAIFLSVFDVHTNRSPLEGKITYSERRVGKMLDARHPEATTLNESWTWALENPRATLVIRQITGAIARRIVAWSKVGDVLEKGERFGMIRFGSRTEVFVPLDAEITIHAGDRVKGGETIIARLAP